MQPSVSLQSKFAMRVEPDKFLTELNKLFERTKDKGTVFLTMKRSKSIDIVHHIITSHVVTLTISHHSRSSSPLFRTTTATQKPKRSKVEPTADDYKCLVRATDGKRKVSTVLAGKDLGRFQDSYQTILKAHMDSLKKRDRRQKKSGGGGSSTAGAGQK